MTRLCFQVLELKAERDALRREISAAQAESAKREKKLKMELERVRQQLEDAAQRNAELQRELKFSEEARIAQVWCVCHRENLTKGRATWATSWAPIEEA